MVNSIEFLVFRFQANRTSEHDSPGAAWQSRGGMWEEILLQCKLKFASWSNSGWELQVRYHYFNYKHVNVRSLSSQTFPFMGIFDLDEDLIPLIQSPRGNAPALQYNLSKERYC